MTAEWACVLVISLSVTFCTSLFVAAVSRSGLLVIACVDRNRIEIVDYGGADRDLSLLAAKLANHCWGVTWAAGYCWTGHSPSSASTGIPSQCP